MAFDADEHRKNAQGGSIQGVAACWVREVWFDLGRLPSTSRDLPLGHDVADLLQRCPNVVVFRGFGRRLGWKPSVSKPGQVIKKIVTTTSSDGPVALNSLDHLEGRGVEISRSLDYDPFIPLGPQSTDGGHRPNYLYMHRLQSLELHPGPGYYDKYALASVTVCLPELTHLCIRGLSGPAQYAMCLEMPNIQTLTYDAILNKVRPTPDPFQVLMEKHGAKLKGLALLQKPCPEELLQIQEHCTNLDTMHTEWVGARFCPPTVTTVGLFGLDSAVYSGSEEQVLASIAGLIDSTVALREVRDMSWRSGLVRQRAFRSQKDPAATSHRKFWAKLSGILHGAAQRVRLIDWRGREVDAECYEVGPGEDTMDEDDRAMEKLVAGSG